MHVEPLDDPGVRERAHAAALTVPGVREIHNLALVDVGGRLELSLHLKLPGDVTLEAAHDVAEQLERAILRGRARGRRGADAPRAAHRDGGGAARSASTPARSSGSCARRRAGRRASCASCAPTSGLVAFLTLGLDGQSSLDDAHARASEIEELIRREQPEIADVIVHTEP